MTVMGGTARRERLLLVFILVLGASLRLLWVRAPLLEAHRWRQVDTAAIARNLYEGPFNVFRPQIDWGGRNGAVESEFPLLPAMVASLYKGLGPQEYLGRIVSVVFSTVTIAGTFVLGAQLLGTSGGLAAAFLIAASPAAVFFGRTFMPDSMMLCFWVWGVAAFVRYFRTGRLRACWLGSAAIGLACLVKFPGVVMLAPIAGAAWDAKGRAAIRDRRFLIAVSVPVLLAAAWYWHAFQLFRETGMTFGILAHPARTYPLTVAPGPWRFAFSKWSTIGLLSGSDFYMTLLARIHQLLLAPWGFAGTLFGLLLWKRDQGRLVADSWLLAMLAFILVAGEGHIGHEYYQLPIVPVGALYFGAFAAPVFDAQTGNVPPWRTVVLAPLLAIVAVTGFYYSGVINSHFRPNNPDIRVLEAGQAVERVVPADALVIVIDDYGATSPLLLYFAHRKGWSFDVENVYPPVIDGLKRQGARFFASTVWSRIERERPDTAAYLRLHRRMDLRGEPADTVVFDLEAISGAKAGVEAARLQVAKTWDVDRASNVARK